MAFGDPQGNFGITGGYGGQFPGAGGATNLSSTLGGNPTNVGGGTMSNAALASMLSNKLATGGWSSLSPQQMASVSALGRYGSSLVPGGLPSPTTDPIQKVLQNNILYKQQQLAPTTATKTFFDAWPNLFATHPPNPTVGTRGYDPLSSYGNWQNPPTLGTGGPWTPGQGYNSVLPSYNRPGVTGSGTGVKSPTKDQSRIGASTAGSFSHDFADALSGGFQPGLSSPNNPFGGLPHNFALGGEIPPGGQGMVGSEMVTANPDGGASVSQMGGPGAMQQMQGLEQQTLGGMAPQQMRDMLMLQQQFGGGQGQGQPGGGGMGGQQSQPGVQPPQPQRQTLADHLIQRGMRTRPPQRQGMGGGPTGPGPGPGGWGMGGNGLGLEGILSRFAA